MQGDRVQRILDLVGDAAADPADGREAGRHIELRSHPLQQLFDIVLLLSGFLASRRETFRPVG